MILTEQHVHPSKVEWTDSEFSFDNKMREREWKDLTNEHVLPSSHKDTDPFFAGAVWLMQQQPQLFSPCVCILFFFYSWLLLLRASLTLQLESWSGEVTSTQQHCPHALKKIGKKKFWISLPVCATDSNKDASMFVVQPRCAEEALIESPCKKWFLFPMMEATVCSNLLCKRSAFYCFVFEAAQKALSSQLS